MKNNYLKFDLIDLQAQHISVATDIIVNSHANNNKIHPNYQRNEIQNILLQSLAPNNKSTFIVARVDTEIVGVGGFEKTRFASDTWVLYLLAVDKKYRNQGIGTALIKKRIAMIEQNNHNGRILVSTKHPERFKKLDFKIIDEDIVNNTTLLMKRFKQI